MYAHSGSRDDGLGCVYHAVRSRDSILLRMLYILSLERPLCNFLHISIEKTKNGSLRFNELVSHIVSESRKGAIIATTDVALQEHKS